jgi:hypothetical protein
MHTESTELETDASTSGSWRFDHDDDETVATVVAAAVADLTDAGVAELDPLYDAGVDPDALNSIFSRADAETELTFEYVGYLVRVIGDGRIHVAEK